MTSSGVLDEAAELALGGLQLEVEPRVGDRQPDLRRHRLEQLDVGFGKDPILARVDVQRAVGLEVGPERQRGKGAKALEPRGGAGEPRVVLQVANDNRLTGERDASGEALAKLEVIEVAPRPFGQPMMDGQRELALFLVEQIEAGAFGLDHFEHLVQRVLEHLVEAREAADRERHRVDGGQRVGGHRG